MELMLKHEELRAALTDLGDSPLSEANVEALEKIYLPSVWKKQTDQCNRFVIFHETYSPKHFCDPLNYIKGINPSSMPPCANVLRQKL